MDGDMLKGIVGAFFGTVGGAASGAAVAVRYVPLPWPITAVGGAIVGGLVGCWLGMTAEMLLD